MTSVQRIKFVVPEAQAFVEVLRVLDVSHPVMLVGDGELAHGIATLAEAVGVEMTASRDLPNTASLNGYRLVVFTELDGDRLGDLLLACLDLSDICVIAPVTARHFSRMPLFIVSIPKSGTHLIYELAQALGYAPGVELIDFPLAQTWYCVEYSNSHTVARDFFVDSVRRAPFGNRHHPAIRSPVLFAYRHPLDILVSEAHYYHLEGKSAFSGYLDGLDFEMRVSRLIDDEWMLGSLRQRVGGFLPWLEMPNVIPTSFEELVGEAGGGSQAAQRRLIWSILLKLQVDGCVAEVAAKVFNKDSATFREGKIGSWRNQLNSAQIAQIEASCGDVISAFGYSTQAEGALIPAAALQHAARPLRFSKVSFEETPLLILQGFMGCNLVRYRDCFFAVPESMGMVLFDTLSEIQIASLPSAKSLEELKTLLVIGREAHDRQYAKMVRVGKALTKGTKSLVFLKNQLEPCILDEYKGYNLIVWQNRYFAVRQSIGPVDFSLGIEQLIASHIFGDVVVASDLDDLLIFVEEVLFPKQRKFAEVEHREALASQRLRELEDNPLVRLGLFISNLFRIER